jgi:hypothetical protein
VARVVSHPASWNFSAIVVSLSGRPYAEAGGIQSTTERAGKGEWD